MIGIDGQVSPLNMAARVLPLAKEGKSSWEIAEKTGFKLQSVRVAISALRARGALERTAPRRQHKTIAEQIKPLFDQGLGAEEIVRQTGHNLRTVKWCICKLRAKAKADAAVEPVAAVAPVAPVDVAAIEPLVIEALPFGRLMPALERAARTDGLVDLLDLTDKTCRWPVGDPGKPGFGFCGDEVSHLCKPYCATHGLRAYAPSAERKAIDRLLNIPKAKRVAA